MLRFFHFMRRYAFFLAFIGLEFLSVNTFLKYHRYQETMLAQSVMNIQGGVNQFFSLFSDLFYLKTENERLLNENTALRNMLLQNFESIPKRSQVTNDTVYLDGKTLFRKYHCFGAKVVANNFYPNHNTLQILIGNQNGIRKDMGVIGDHGIVGVITNVSKHYAEVLSILNKSYNISAIHKRSSYTGQLSWDGNSLHELVLKHIPYTADVQVGDSIFTSQYSEKFLPMTLIGTVSSIRKDSIKNAYIIRVKLASDLKNITYVYVVENVLQEDKDQLENNSDFKE